MLLSTKILILFLYRERGLLMYQLEETLLVAYSLGHCLEITDGQVPFTKLVTKFPAVKYKVWSYKVMI